MPRFVFPAWILAGLLLLAGLHPVSAASAPSFYLHDGDTVVFYGDSITAQEFYGRDIETYVVTRFPKMHVKFINSGWSGDKVSGGGGGGIELRLKRDVINYKPTVVTVFLGMNDGGYAPYDEAAFQKYSTGLTHIVDELTQALPGVRITLFTPSFFDYDATPRAPLPTPPVYAFRTPAADYNQTLLKYGAFVKQLGAERHLTVVDLNAPLADATAEGRKTDPKFALSPDGVHPYEDGHLIMAAAVLKTWNAPATVADVALTPGKPHMVTAPLPWPVPAGALPAFAVSPLPGSLDVFRAHVAPAKKPVKLSASSQIVVDGQPAAPIADPSGVDLTTLPTLPENVQAQTVYTLIDQRVTAWHNFWQDRKTGVAHRNDVPTDDELSRLRAEVTAEDAARSQAYAAAQPKPHTFVLQP